MGEQYFKGVLAGYLGANFMCGPITEWQIDIIKENISHYCEATIDHSQLSYQEKEDQKRQMKQESGGQNFYTRFYVPEKVCK
jgi:hypothetical protein